LVGLRSDAPQHVLQRLFKHERVMLSPHIAGITHESYFKLANVLADKVLNDVADGNL
jgi:phosphoglycerate dehydrogenase-like enzyme